MTIELSKNHLIRLSALVETRMGLNFSHEKWKDLSRAITRASHHFGFKNVEEFCEWLLTQQLSASQIEMLASHLTIGETYFFRDPSCWESLEQKLIPEWLSAHPDPRHPLRIWSAGCSTGEEPYTIAMILDKLGGSSFGGREVTILATDINPDFLSKAKDGVYGKWSFRKTPSDLRQHCFKKISEHSFHILPRYRNKVSFNYLNLIDDNYPSLKSNTNAMDIIFCRNVLMYFSEDRRREVVKRLQNCLAENGYLIVSSIEATLINDSSWVQIPCPNSFLFQKNSHPGSSKATVPPAVFKPLSFIQPVHVIPGVKPAVAGPVHSLPFVAAQKIKHAEPAPNAGLYEEALLLAEQNRHEEAVDKLSFILKHDKHDIMAKILMARVRADQGQLMEALEWCDNALTDDKLNVSAYFLMATVLLEMGRVDEALSALKKVLYLDPWFVIAYFIRGNVAWQNGKMREARRDFEQVLSIMKEKYTDTALIPESGGLTAGRLKQIIHTMIYKEKIA